MATSILLCLILASSCSSVVSKIPEQKQTSKSTAITSNTLLGHWQLVNVKWSKDLGKIPNLAEYLLNSRIEFSLDINSRWSEIQADGSFTGKDLYKKSFGNEVQSISGAFRIVGDKIFLYYDYNKGYAGVPIPAFFMNEYLIVIADPDTGNFFLPKATFENNNLVLTFMETYETSNKMYFKLEFIRSSASSSDILPKFSYLETP